MKKGFFVILVVAVTAFFIHGCQASGAATTPDNSKKAGYPVGHDLHPDTKQDQKNGSHPLPGYS